MPAELGTSACRPVHTTGPRNDWAPKHVVWLSPFFIDTFEVTNQRYKQCVTAGACPQPFILNDPLNDPVAAESPVAAVTWGAAHDYCQWRGKRLPTEAEWEAAARGKLGNQFPWGDDPPASPASKFASYPAPRVGSDARDVSSFGVHDMLGGVAEWVNDWYGGPYAAATDPVHDPQGPVGAQRGFVKCCKADDWSRIFAWEDAKVYRGTRSAAAGGYELNQRDRDYPLWIRDYDKGAWRDLGFRCARDGKAKAGHEDPLPVQRDLKWQWY
jgi:formylglycine-generating enzyme required for sulfatase activity